LGNVLFGNITTERKGADGKFKTVNISKTGNLGYECTVWTETGKPEVSEEALEPFDLPFIKDYVEYLSLQKVLGTSLKGIKDEVDSNGFLHPSFNLNTVVTYRSSCVAKGSLVMVNRNYADSSVGVPIENIVAGDYVYCFDDELKPRLRKVLWAGKTGHKKVIRIHFKRHKGIMGYLDVTPEHLIRMADGTYIQAQDILKYRSKMFHLRSRLNRSVLSIHREIGMVRDRLLATNHKEIFEHVFVYSELGGIVGKKDHVHHIDGQHWNHEFSNLQLMSGVEHCRYHGKLRNADRTGEIYLRNVHILREGRKKVTPRYGADHHSSLKYTKFAALVLLAKGKGKLKYFPHDFETTKKLLTRLGIDWKNVRLRYGEDGRFIPKWRLESALVEGGKSGALRILRLGHARFV